MVLCCFTQHTSTSSIRGHPEFFLLCKTLIAGSRDIGLRFRFRLIPKFNLVESLGFDVKFLTLSWRWQMFVCLFIVPTMWQAAVVVINK